MPGVPCPSKVDIIERESRRYLQGYTVHDLRYFAPRPTETTYCLSSNSWLIGSKPIVRTSTRQKRLCRSKRLKQMVTNFDWRHGLLYASWICYGLRRSYSEKERQQYCEIVHRDLFIKSNRRILLPLTS
jgi:hypothetical protein